LQQILKFKSDWSHCLEGGQLEGCEYVKGWKNTFGFSEKFVNQLMLLAYKRGVEHGKMIGERDGAEKENDRWKKIIEEVEAKFRI
jgi:hypothetical protein